LEQVGSNFARYTVSLVCEPARVNRKFNFIIKNEVALKSTGASREMVAEIFKNGRDVSA
jgi:hypothetical protein